MLSTIKKYILPMNAVEEEEDLFSYLGIEDPSATTEPEKPTETEPEKPEDKPTEPTNDTDSGEGETDPEPTKPVENPNNKQNNAWAQMRTENKRLNDLIKRLGVTTKLDTNAPDFMDKLEQTILKAEAKQQNIDPVILQKIAQLEKRDREYAEFEAKRNAAIGFQRVKDTFGLDDKGLQAFADQLVAAGMNPYEDGNINLLNEYKLRNFDALVKAASEKAVQAEVSRLTKAQTHGSTPNTSTGTGEPEKVEVKSVADLDKWLSNK